MKFLTKSTNDLLKLSNQFSSNSILPTLTKSYLTFDVFLAYLNSNDIPLSASEGISIGRLLIREKYDSKTQKYANNNDFYSQSIDILLINNIKKGNFLAAQF